MCFHKQFNLDNPFRRVLTNEPTDKELCYAFEILSETIKNKYDEYGDLCVEPFIDYLNEYLRCQEELNKMKFKLLNTNDC